jgi:hypothetical protein
VKLPTREVPGKDPFHSIWPMTLPIRTGAPRAKAHAGVGEPANIGTSESWPDPDACDESEADLPGPPEGMVLRCRCHCHCGSEHSQRRYDGLRRLEDWQDCRSDGTLTARSDSVAGSDLHDRRGHLAMGILH